MYAYPPFAAAERVAPIPTLLNPMLELFLQEIPSSTAVTRTGIIMGTSGKHRVLQFSGRRRGRAVYEANYMKVMNELYDSNISRPLICPKVMRDLQDLRLKILLSFLLTMLAVSATPQHAKGLPSISQQVPHFQVTIAGQPLTAGLNNTVKIEVTNLYDTVYDVDLSITVPAQLTLLGDNHWRLPSLGPGEKFNLTYAIFPPSSTIGSNYVGSLVASYRQLGNVAYTTESHPISYSVRGWIELVIFSVTIFPLRVPPGGNLSISGNLVNRGNVAAMNTNVSVFSPIATATSGSFVLIGQADPNIPRPFSFTMFVSRSAREGNFPIVITARYTNTELAGVSFTTLYRGQFAVGAAVVRPPTPTESAQGPIATLLDILRYLFRVFFGSSFVITATAITRTSTQRLR